MLLTRIHRQHSNIGEQRSRSSRSDEQLLDNTNMPVYRGSLEPGDLLTNTAPLCASEWAIVQNPEEAWTQTACKSNHRFGLHDSEACACRLLSPHGPSSDCRIQGSRGLVHSVLAGVLPSCTCLQGSGILIARSFADICWLNTSSL